MGHETATHSLVYRVIESNNGEIRGSHSALDTLSKPSRPNLGRFDY